MQLSKNQKNLSQFFSPFPESTWNFQYFQQKDEPKKWFLTEIIDWKKRSYLKAQKTPYQNTYGQSTC